MKKKIELPVVFALFTALLVAVGGCGRARGNRSAQARLSSTENEFLATVEDMQAGADDFANAFDVTSARRDYRERMSDDVAELVKWVEQMTADCDQLGHSVCPNGGGGDGDVSGQCMTGGHLMNKGEMDQLKQLLHSVRDSLDQFWEQCGDAWLPPCGQAEVQHSREIAGALAKLRTYCERMWSASPARGGLASAGAMSRGEIRWGDCKQ